MGAVGALAGFAAQMAIREDFIKSGKIAADKAFNVVATQDGSTYYFGDLLNEGLVATRQGNYSVGTLVAGVTAKGQRRIQFEFWFGGVRYRPTLVFRGLTVASVFRQ